VEPVNGACPSCGAAIGEREITAKIDTEELRRKWEERVERARQVTIVATVGAKTDLGRIRENNEDKFEFYMPDDEDTLARKGSFYAVADGMGGHAAGQIASELALKTVIDQYYSDNSMAIEQSIRNAVQMANSMIHGASQAIVERSGMGTTFSALIIRGEEAIIAQVGDSRCYRLRGGKLEQLTEDHSWVNEQVRRGGMTREEAEQSPFRNIITRSLGNLPNVEPDIFQQELHEGDIFLLCSDGLTGEVSDDELKDALRNSAPSKAAWDLVELALNHGGKDNVTVLIVAVRDIIRKERKRKGLAGLLARD
jgi:protein phosphatase